MNCEFHIRFSFDWSDLNSTVADQRIAMHNKSIKFESFDDTWWVITVTIIIIAIIMDYYFHWTYTKSLWAFEPNSIFFLLFSSFFKRKFQFCNWWSETEYFYSSKSSWCIIIETFLSSSFFAFLEWAPKFFNPVIVVPIFFSKMGEKNSSTFVVRMSILKMLSSFIACPNVEMILAKEHNFPQSFGHLCL